MTSRAIDIVKLVGGGLVDAAHQAADREGSMVCSCNGHSSVMKAN